MQPVIFEKVTFKNLFSYGNVPTEFSLNECGLNLIVGNSGAGKSTLLDAILFGLFGKTYKKVNKSAIVNSINDKGCEVTIDFRVGHDAYSVLRGVKPNLFEIKKNGETIDKDAKALDLQNTLENRILGGVNWNTFTQTFVIGTANYVPFMMLDAAKRRELVETLLGLSVFAEASIIAKKRLSDSEVERTAIGSNIRVLQALIEEKNKSARLLYEQKMRVEQSNSTNVADMQSKIEQIEQSIKTDMASLTDLKVKMDQTKDAEIASFDKAASRSEMNELILRKKEWSDVVSLFSSDSCPTCKRALDKNDTSHFDYHGAVSNLEEIQQRVKVLTEAATSFSSYETSLAQLIEAGKRIANDVRSKQAQIASFKSSIESMRAEQAKSIDSSAIDSIVEEIRETESDIASLTLQMEQKTHHAKHLKMCVDLLKDDGIKANIIKVFLPVMNKMISDFNREFELEFDFSFDERFNETIKGRGRDDYVYENISQGEKRRLDISILFTWIEIARMKNSLNSNLMIADEIMDSSLDSQAVGVLVNIFKRWIEESGNSIFIISHRQELMDSFFDAVYQVSKAGQFSEIEKVNK